MFRAAALLRLAGLTADALLCRSAPTAPHCTWPHHRRADLTQGWGGFRARRVVQLLRPLRQDRWTRGSIVWGALAERVKWGLWVCNFERGRALSCSSSAHCDMMGLGTTTTVPAGSARLKA